MNDFYQASLPLDMFLDQNPYDVEEGHRSKRRAVAKDDKVRKWRKDFDTVATKVGKVSCQSFGCFKWGGEVQAPPPPQVDLGMPFW